MQFRLVPQFLFSWLSFKTILTNFRMYICIWMDFVFVTFQKLKDNVMKKYGEN